MTRLFKKLSIKSKINGNSIVLMVILVLNVGYAIYSMNQVGTELHTIIAEDIPLTEHVTLSTEAQLEQVIHMERALRYGLNMKQDQQAASNYKKEVEKFNKLDKQFTKEIQLSKTIATEVITISPDQSHIEKHNEINQLLISIETAQKNFVIHVNEVFSSLDSGKVNNALTKIATVEKESDELSKKLTGLLVDIKHFILEAGHHAESVELMALKVLIISVIVSVIICGFSSMAISNFVSKRLADATQGMGFIAKGDLTHTGEGETQDDLQQSIQTMRNSLLDMIKQINSTTTQLSTNTEEMSTLSVNACKSTQQQELEIHQITTAMNEINATLQEVAENINSTSVAANNANEETKRGREVVEHTVTGIQQLAEQIDNAAEVIAQVEQDSENINTVLEVIKSIAEQTNLLALNAAIEAARAGEQGRGFAVVADEVRSLAGRTQESTKEINQIIEKLQIGSRDAVAVIKQGHNQVEAVVEEAKLAGTSLMTIEESVSNIDQMCSQFATATEEQLSVMNEVNCNITRVNDSAILNAESAEKTSTFATNLVDITGSLNNLVQRFKV